MPPSAPPPAPQGLPPWMPTLPAAPPGVAPPFTAPPRGAVPTQPPTPTQPPEGLLPPPLGAPPKFGRPPECCGRPPELGAPPLDEPPWSVPGSASVAPPQFVKAVPMTSTHPMLNCRFTMRSPGASRVPTTVAAIYQGKRAARVAPGTPWHRTVGRTDRANGLNPSRPQRSLHPTPARAMAESTPRARATTASSRSRRAETRRSEARARPR